VLRRVVIAMMLLAAPRSAFAHHSFAMYDSTKLVTVDGTVTNFQWTNPHVLLFLTGTSGPGEAATSWSIELPTSPGNLGRMGWTKHSLKAGDHVVVELNPLRDGKHGGSFKKATLDGGKVLLANPVGRSADGGVSYGADEAKPDAGSDGGKPKRGWGCSIQGQASSDAWPMLALSLAVVFRVRRRRRTPNRYSRA
jgi:MYXO-CTERM domain-containing protein